MARQKGLALRIPGIATVRGQIWPTNVSFRDTRYAFHVGINSMADARKVRDEFRRKGRLAIIVGGTTTLKAGRSYFPYAVFIGGRVR